MKNDFLKLTETQRILYRQLYKKDLYSFVKDFWQEADPEKFVDGKLVQFYCEFFQYLCRPWIGYDGPEKEPEIPEWSDDIEIIDVRQNKQNGNINIPPRHSKSMVFNVLAGVWMWLNEPIRLASISHTQGLAGKMNSKRQAVLNSDRFKFFFPEIVLKTNTTFSLIDTRGGELYSINRDALTGYGFDIGVCDDLTNAEVARKDKEEMNNAWSFYQNTLPSRINNPSKYVILNIQQRLAPNDITGRISTNELLKKQYIFVVLPAQFKKHTFIVCPISGDVFEFNVGDYLWPERFGDYSMLKAMVGETVWQTQYLQNPVASDRTVIKEDMLKEEDCTNVPGWDTSTQSIDLQSVSIIYGSHDFPVKDKVLSDFTGSVLAYRINKTIYIVDCAEVKQNFSRSKQYLKNLAEIYPGIINIIEDKANGSPLMTELQDDVPGMVAFSPGTADKVERMSYASDYVQSGNVIFVKTKWDDENKKRVLNEGLQNLKQKLIAFPFVQHDDICDAFSMLILHVFQSVRLSVYGRAFNELNIKEQLDEDINYSTMFFNRDGSTWKLVEIGIKYDLISRIYVLRETTFKADLTLALKKMKEFAPDKNVFIDSSLDESLSGLYDSKNDINIESYVPSDFQMSCMELNRAIGSKQVLILKQCKFTINDIEEVRYDAKDRGKIKTVQDGFVACLRTALNYFGGI